MEFYLHEKFNFLTGFVLLILLVLSFACQDKNSLRAEIESLPVQIKVDRFDRKFHEASPEQIPYLKEEYPFLFPQNNLMIVFG